jgi:hypothetical protein
MASCFGRMSVGQLACERSLARASALTYGTVFALPQQTTMGLRTEIISVLDKNRTMSLSPRSAFPNARVVELVDTHV